MPRGKYRLRVTWTNKERNKARLIKKMLKISGLVQNSNLIFCLFVDK